VLYFALTGSAPFGEKDPQVILARMLASEVDVSAFDPEVGRWMQRALSPNSADRFADAAEMQEAWRDTVRIVLDREHTVPWWRRFFSGEHERVESA
jgi:hypothetical protein